MSVPVVRTRMTKRKMNPKRTYPKKNLKSTKMNDPVCLTPWDSQWNQVWDAVNDTHFTCLRGQGEAGYQASYVLAKNNIETNNKVLCFKERAGKPGGGKGILIGEDKTFVLSTLVDSDICFGRNASAIGCDIYNFRITGDIACNMNATSCDSAGHSGPSVLIRIHQKEET